MLKLVLRAVMGCLVLASGLAHADGLDPALPGYRPINALQGEITLVGSNTMSDVAAMWVDRFTCFYPDVKINIVVKGAENAMPAVMNGEATIGMLSREANAQEIEDFTKKLGHAPKLLVPSLERIAIFVHKDNPLNEVTLAQLDAIFSQTLKRGEAREFKSWGDLGVKGSLAAQPIALQGRSDTTGSQVFLKTLILQGGEFRTGITKNEDNMKLVKAIASDPAAIGFAGETYQYPGTKTLSISWKAGEPAYAIDSEADAHGTYPLVRPLQFVVNQAPDKALGDVEREFLRYVFSAMGQEDVVKAGFHPISARPAHTALGAVGLDKLN